MTGTALPPFISVLSLFAIFVFCHSLSVTLFHTGPLPTWTAAPVYLSPLLFYIPLALFANELLNLRGGARSVRKAGETDPAHGDVLNHADALVSEHRANYLWE